MDITYIIQYLYIVFLKIFFSLEKYYVLVHNNEKKNKYISKLKIINNFVQYSHKTFI